MPLNENVKQALLGTWLEPIRKWGIENTLDATIRSVAIQYHKHTVFPPKSKIFRALAECNYDEVKVVWLGQDPYHDGSATGLAFANEPGTNLSPSLKILKKEWQSNQVSEEFDPTLLSYAHQGVLFLNTALTVLEASPLSHADIWKDWTREFLSNLSADKTDLVYVLFGKKAQGWKNHITHGHVLNIVHPAAESYTPEPRGFYGSRLFDKTNSKLIEIGKEPIIW